MDISGFSIPEFLSDERSLGVFFLVTVAMGGGAAWLAGRAIAATWRPWWHVAFYMLLLALAVRFIHFALFSSKTAVAALLSGRLRGLLDFGLIAFRLTRVRQMVTCYNWINVRSGVFGWRRSAESGVPDAAESG